MTTSRFLTQNGPFAANETFFEKTIVFIFLLAFFIVQN